VCVCVCDVHVYVCISVSIQSLIPKLLYISEQLLVVIYGLEFTQWLHCELLVTVTCFEQLMTRHGTVSDIMVSLFAVLMLIQWQGFVLVGADYRIY
jgi:hypothetical protein